MSRTARTYSNTATLVGNWNEELELQRLKRRHFTEMMEQGMLASQKRSTIDDKVELSPCEGGFVHFGDIVQVSNVQTNAPLSVDFLEKLFTDPETGSVEYAVHTSAVCKVPTARNCFVVVKFDEPEMDPDSDDPMSTVLKYGQKFQLVTHPKSPQGFLGSCKASPERVAKYSGKQEVQIQPKPVYNTCWKVLSIDSTMRLETEGTPVPVNANVVICHCTTNQNLASSTEIRAGSDYGVEFEAFCATMLNFVKAEKPENLWKFVMGPPLEEEK